MSPVHFGLEAISRVAMERNSVGPEVQTPFILSIEDVIKSHKVVSIQNTLTTRRYIVKQWYMLPRV